MILKINSTPLFINKTYTSLSSAGKQVSFAQNINNTDIFSNIPSRCNDKIRINFDGADHLKMNGTLDGLDCSLDFKRSEDNAKRKNINVTGYYAGKQVYINCTYKDKKHHIYQGTYGDKTFDITYRVGGIFVNDYMKGKINGEYFKAKFPSASCKDENRNLMILLLGLSGYVPTTKGCNFDFVEPSLTRCSYFNGGLDCNNRPMYTMLDDIWTDPLPVPCV